MKQIKNNRVKNRSLTNLHTGQLPFTKIFTEKGIVDVSILWEINEESFLVNKTEGVLGVNITIEDESASFRIGDDGGETEIRIGGLASNLTGFSGLAFYPTADTGNIVAMNELNIFSDLLSFRNSSGQDYFLAEDGVGTIFKVNELYLEDLPVFADDTAASTLGTDQVYKTATGELRIKL